MRTRRTTARRAAQWIERQRDHAADGTAIVLAIIPANEWAPVGMVGLSGLETIFIDREPGNLASG
jgi:hypothetical protein